MTESRKKPHFNHEFLLSSIILVQPRAHAGNHGLGLTCRPRCSTKDTGVVAILPVRIHPREHLLPLGLLSAKTQMAQEVKVITRARTAPATPAPTASACVWVEGVVTSMVLLFVAFCLDINRFATGRQLVVRIFRPVSQGAHGSTHRPRFPS